MKLFRFILSMSLPLQVLQLDTGCKVENCNNSPNQENQSMSSNTFEENNNLSSKRKRRNCSAIPPFTDLTRAYELNRDCCQNGGTCFLGTFCICPKYFTGRHCEMINESGGVCDC